MTLQKWTVRPLVLSVFRRSCYREDISQDAAERDFIIWDRWSCWTCSHLHELGDCLWCQNTSGHLSRTGRHRFFPSISFLPRVKNDHSSDQVHVLNFMTHKTDRMLWVTLFRKKIMDNVQSMFHRKTITATVLPKYSSITTTSTTTRTTELFIL